MTGIFFRLLDVAPGDKAEVLRRAISLMNHGGDGSADESRVFERPAHGFSSLEGTPFSYWLPEAVLTVINSFDQFEGHGRNVRQGLATSDDFRFLRAWWEVGDGRIGTTWFNFAKGGNFSPFYNDLPLVIEWQDGGAVLRAKVVAEYGNAGKRIYNEEYYLLPGITWPLRAHRFAPNILPAHCIFSVRGYSAFTPKDELLSTLGIFNSTCFDFIFKAFLGRFGHPEFIVGILQRLPWVSPSGPVRIRVSSLAERAWSLRRRLDASDETSHAFHLPTGQRERAKALDRLAIEQKLNEIQREIDDAAFELYGIDAESRAVVEAITNRAALLTSEVGDETDADDATGNDDANVSFEGTLLSWLVGLAFGRFDPRLTTGERDMPHEPEPFDPLPVRSPGMWPVDEERSVPPPDILVDDPGHDRDITSHVTAVAELVDVSVPAEVRRWLARGFFPLHIKMYSKSRRKAPIYWQLSTPSASYSVWLYIHAFTRDTMFRVQNDYVVPRLRHEESRLASLEQEAGERGTSAQRKEIADQGTFVAELRGFLDEVRRITPLWNPDLDDGVVINFAPLWRLVPQHRQWQKDLKSTWDSLRAGKYDWAHLAMHLWPERVVPKCATDRSLAIAHDLEDVFWEQNEEGRWMARETPTRPTDELVAERTSAAVKAALQSLVDAPDTTAGRAKRRRAANGTTTRGGR